MKELQVRNCSFEKPVNIGLGEQATFRLEFLCPRCSTFTDARGIGSVKGTAFAVVCRGCGEMTMIESDQRHSIVVRDYFPRMQLSVDPSVPGSMQEYYLEAQRCFSVSAWRACAIMARLFAHSVMKDRNAKGHDLYEQIKNLGARGILTPALTSLCKQIRVFGDYDVSELGREDAEAALRYCEWLIEYIYVLPTRIQAGRATPEAPPPA